MYKKAHFPLFHNHYPNCAPQGAPQDQRTPCLVPRDTKHPGPWVTLTRAVLLANATLSFTELATAPPVDVAGAPSFRAVEGTWESGNGCTNTYCLFAVIWYNF